MSEIPLNIKHPAGFVVLTAVVKNGTREPTIRGNIPPPSSGQKISRARNERVASGYENTSVYIRTTGRYLSEEGNILTASCLKFSVVFFSPFRKFPGFCLYYRMVASF
jgi:hypothetical protein